MVQMPVSFPLRVELPSRDPTVAFAEVGYLRCSVALPYGRRGSSRPGRRSFARADLPDGAIEEADTRCMDSSVA